MRIDQTALLIPLAIVILAAGFKLEIDRHKPKPQPAPVEVQVLRASVAGYHWRRVRYTNDWMLVRESDGIVMGTTHEGPFGCQVCIDGCRAILPESTKYYENCDFGRRAAEKWLAHSLGGTS